MTHQVRGRMTFELGKALTALIDGRQRMTTEEHEFWVERVVEYLELGIALDPARAMADDDLDLWREYGDEADFSKLGGEPEEE